MADVISDEDRRMIDAALKAGVANKVHEGVRTNPEPRSWNKRPRGRPPARETAARVVDAKRMASQGESAKVIAKAIGFKTVAPFYAFARRHGIEFRRVPHADRVVQPKYAAETARAQKNAKRRANVSDRRRFKETVVPQGRVGMRLDADHPANVDGRTIHVDRRVHPGDPDTQTQSILKDGAHNSKIGGDVLVGWLKGARIVTLTLPERETCPRSCHIWDACYGNMESRAARWIPGPELERRIADEIDALCAKHERVLVRLHILGDFYSTEYLALWSDLLDRHDNLFVFGFTAHLPLSELGSQIAMMRDVMHPGRFFIRHSGTAGEWGSVTLDFPTERKTIGDAIICPEQVDAMNAAETARHCGSCGVCWSCARAVWFVEH